MKIACGSCSTLYDDAKRECPNCTFPNAKFAEPLLSPIEINVDLGVARTMTELAAVLKISTDEVWQQAAEWWITEQRRKKKWA